MLRKLAVNAPKAMLGISSVATVTSLTYLYNTDTRMQRQMQFYGRTWHIIAHYYYEFKMYNDSARFDALHDKYAPEALDLIRDLRGLYIKAAQVASVRPEFVPKAYREAFAELQSEVPPAEYPLIKETIEKEFGCSVEELFLTFDEVPVGSASIGQAHIARLKETGEEVVVKVQYPNAKELFSADLSCLEVLCWLSQPDALPLMKKISTQFLQELDFDAEKDNLIDTYSAIMPKYSKLVAVPKVYEKYCSSKVVTMEYLKGPKLDKEVMRSLKSVGIDMGGNDVRKWLKSQNKIDDEDGEFDAGSLFPEKNNDTKSFELPWYISWLSSVVDVFYFLRLGEQVSRRVLGWSATAVNTVIGETRWGTNMLSYLEQTDTLANVGNLLQTLITVHGYEIFSTPVFNGDPHPGNIILLEDNRIGLIDYGQCTRLDDESRLKIARVIVAVAENEDDETLARYMRELGFVTKNDDTAFLATFSKLVFGPIKPEYMSPSFHQKLHGSDKITVFPNSIIMVTRVSSLLRGLGLVFRYNFDISSQWKEAATEAVRLDGVAATTIPKY